MKLIFITLLLSSVVTLAANKVVQKARVIDEKIVAAEGCSITGDYTNSGYATTEYKYTVTMKIKILQKQELYNVNVKKSLFRKPQETEVPNSKKAGPDKTIASTRSISMVARFPTEFNRLGLLKACEDESLFINTGSYPPPPPRPPEPPPKKAPVATQTIPETPTTPATDPFPIEVLPGNPLDPAPALPELPDLTPSSTTTPATVTTKTPAPTKIPGPEKAEVKK